MENTDTTIILLGVIILIVLFIGFIVYKIYTLKEPEEGAKQLFKSQYDLYKNKDIDELAKTWAKEHLDRKDKNSKPPK